MIPSQDEKPESGPVLVTGATGTLGRPLVRKLVGLGVEVRALSRRPAMAAATGVSWWKGDLMSSEGLEEALAGVRCVVHCASSQKGDPDAAKNLLDVMGRSGVPDLVYISIVGIDRVPLGYYNSKLESEKLIAASDRRSTVLRTTQFHDLIARGCRALSRSPVMLVPAGTSFQPIDVREVADRLVELATGRPGLGRVDDMGGPAVRPATDLARRFLKAHRRRRPVVSVRIPGAAFAGYRNGFHCVPDKAVGRKSFDEFLEEQLGRPTP